MSETNISGYASANSEPLTAANYNEVDALLFAKLSYYPFEKVYPNGSYAGKTVSIKEYAQAILASQSPNEDTNDELLLALVNSNRYAECKITRMQSSEGTDSQWAAMTVNINDGSNTSVVAMRGTDGTTAGWREDFELLGSTQGTQAQKLSRQYLESCEAEHILATGHSKGGNDVVSAYAMADAATREKVIHIDNFDGPGVNDKFSELYKEGYSELAAKLDNYYPQDSIVGLLMDNNPGKNHFIYSNSSESEMSNMGILAEHDSLAWQVDGSGFVEADQSIFSKVLDTTTDGIVENLSQDERIQLFTVLCELQIPEWIGDDTAPYEMDEKSREAWLDEQVRAGKITQEEADRYRKNGVSKLEAFFILFNGLTRQEQLLLISILASGVITFAELFVMENIKEFIDKKVEELERACVRFATLIAQKSREIAEAAYNFVDDVKQKVESTWQKVQDFFSPKKRRGDGAGAGGTVAFAAEPDALQQIAAELQTQCAMLQNCAQTVQSIANSVCWSTSVSYGWQIGRLADNVRSEARMCVRMGNGLSKTAVLYQKTERKIAAEAGL